ncbi:MAG: hypothetical protein WCY72_07910 [Lysobacteraceae bacterium]
MFDQDTRHRKLELPGDMLVVLSRIVPWDMFRERLEAAVGKTPDAKRDTRPRYDVVLMFKPHNLRRLMMMLSLAMTKC